MITPKDAEAQLEDLKNRLRCWETKVWMRHAENPTPVARSIDCVMCRGTGKMHYCLVDGCGSEPTDECLHPTESELADYARIMTESKTLMNLVEAAAKKGLVKMQQEGRDPRKLVESLLSGLAKQ